MIKKSTRFYPFGLRLRASVLTGLLALLMIQYLPEPSMAMAGTTFSSPALTIITPRGVQRGTTQTFRFSGARLETAQEVFLYDSPGITVQKIEKVNANSINVTLEIASDVRLGEHVAQVRTLHGISDYRTFYVGRLKELNEVEPNNDLETAQLVENNVTVNGVVQTEDIDYLVVEAKKGQRISVEIEAIRLGVMFDPFIALLDENRFELAVSDDTPQLKQDAFLSVAAPADGKYYVMIRESSYGGNGNCRYRIHVGDFGRPAAVYPAGGKPGELTKLTFIGDPAGPIEKEIQLPSEMNSRPGLFFEDEKGSSPSALPFRISDLPNVLEVEPNNNFAQCTSVVDGPHAFNGIIHSEGEFDYFKFTAKKGQVFDIHCYARRIGSGLDSVMHLFDANKKVLVGDDDARRPDSFFRYTFPADGEYYIRVYDHLRRGQPDFVYRIEFQPVKPGLALSIPRVDRYSQQRQTIVVPQGNRFATLVNAGRRNFGGEIQLLEDGLIPGIKMHSRPMAANLNVMPVVFEADAAAPIGGALVDFKGRHVDPAKNISGGFGNLADFALGFPNNTRYYGCNVNKLAMAVSEKVPFKLEMIQPKVPLVRNGSINLKIVVHRDEGFDGRILVQFPFRSPGVGTSYQLEIKKGTNEINYPLNANANAQFGKWPVYVIGRGEYKGPTWVSTQLAELEVAPPLVTMAIKKVVVVQGQSAKIVCTLTHAKPFEGEATAELIGLPPNVTVNTPQKYTKDTKELVFDVTTTDKSPVGKHRSMFVRSTIMQNGEPIVSTAGRGELQIVKPKPPKKTIIAKKDQPGKPAPKASPAAKQQQK